MPITPVRRATASLFFLSCLFPPVLDALPYAMSGDVCLRNQILILNDEGITRGITMTWPYALGDLYYSLQESGFEDSDYSFVGYSLLERLKAESETGIVQSSAFLNVGTGSQPFRSFYSFQRDSLETGVGLSCMGKHTVLNLRATYSAEPYDGDNLRLDGSYAGVSIGNWTLAVDQVERWWGPGWEGSLILSNNARPFPALSVTRNSSEPFDLPGLRLLGNWTLTTFMGTLMNDELQTPNNPMLWGLRVEIQPFDWLSIGLSRTAQWGGKGRPKGLKTFWNLISGNDNNGDSLSVSEEPGNQLAGFDFRAKPFRRLPAAFYGQLIGEDAGGFMPTKLMYLGGIETWGVFRPLKDSTWRVHLEYADTAARYSLTGSASNNYRYGYNHTIYSQGYRFKGECLGHAMDGDGDMLSLGGLLCESSGRFWGVLLRRTRLDRHNNPYYSDVHTVSRSKANVNSIELYGGFEIERLTIEWALSYMDFGSARLIQVDDNFQLSTSVVYQY